MKRILITITGLLVFLILAFCVWVLPLIFDPLSEKEIEEGLFILLILGAVVLYLYFKGK